MIVFYQNDKTGEFKTHKDRFTPSRTEFLTLLNSIDTATGTIGIIGASEIHLFSFSKNGIHHEIDSLQQQSLAKKVKIRLEMVLLIFDETA